MVFYDNSAILRLYWAGDNLGECDEFVMSNAWRRIDRSTCCPGSGVHRATTVPHMPPIQLEKTLCVPECNNVKRQSCVIQWTILKS